MASVCGSLDCKSRSNVLTGDSLIQVDQTPDPFGQCKEHSNNSISLIIGMKGTQTLIDCVLINHSTGQLQGHSASFFRCFNLHLHSELSPP